MEKKQSWIMLIVLVVACMTIRGARLETNSMETTVLVDPQKSSASVGETFDVNITVANVTNLYSWEVRISFNANILDAVEEFGTETLNVTGEWVGNGTGSETFFNVENKPVVTESETVYVDGVNKTRDVDYYMIYEVGVIMFYVAPPADAPVTVDYQWTREWLVMPEEGNFLKDYFNSTYGKDTLWLYSINNTAGTISLGAIVEAPYPETGANGTGILATIRFYVEDVGATLLHFERSKLFTVVSGVAVEIEHTAVDGVFDNRAAPYLPPIALFEAEPLIANVNETITFNASASYDPDAWLVSYEWDFGDGTTRIYMRDVNLTSMTSHAYEHSGTYTVNLTVTDYDDLTDTATKNVTVTLPLGTIAGRITTASTGLPIEGASVTANGYTNTTDAEGNYTITDVPAGTYNVTASAAGYESSSQTDITVVAGETTPLDFTLALLPTTGTIAGIFKDSSTGDPIADATVTANNLSGTTNSSGAYVIPNVPPGTYNVTASATGYEDSSQIDIIVVAGQTTTVDFELEPLTHTLKVISDPITGVEFSIDETVHVTSWTGTLTEGTYTITMPSTWHIGTEEYTFEYWEDTCTDTVRVITLTANTTITATYKPVQVHPTASFTFSPTEPDVAETVTFNASASNDTDGTIVSYFWDFGDDTNATETDPITTHTYTEPETYTVTLTVTDNDGLTHTVSKSVTVKEAPPSGLPFELFIAAAGVTAIIIVAIAFYYLRSQKTKPT